MFIDSYTRHKTEEQVLADSNNAPWCYTDPGSIGHWHHERMLDSLRPLLEHCSDTSWMTVGDGRFGSDAHFLKGHVRTATATSISASTLAIAKERGWIDSYSEQNAESLSYPDDSFDFVLCKETFHHFPRPAVGFYEMMRVAKVGVVLIEPLDSAWSPLLALKRMIKRILRRDHSYDQFEPSGNFVYRLSINEISKKLTALGCPLFAWKGMNTFWYAPFDHARRGLFSRAWIVSNLGILVQDVACALRLLSPGIATVVCLKSDPPAPLTDALRSAGFHVRFLPKNPYT